MQSVSEEQRTIFSKQEKNAMLFMPDVQLLVPQMLTMCAGEVIQVTMLLLIKVLVERYVEMANEGLIMHVMMAISNQEMDVQTTVLLR